MLSKSMAYNDQMQSLIARFMGHPGGPHVGLMNLAIWDVTFIYDNEHIEMIKN